MLETHKEMSDQEATEGKDGSRHKTQIFMGREYKNSSHGMISVSVSIRTV
jgi:hypothetical protein